MSSNGRMSDFSTFYREYARGGIHAASAAAMTAFGLLTIYHDAFAVLAVLSYVVPALYVYAERDSDSEPDSGRNADANRSEPSSSAEPGAPSESDDERVGERARGKRYGGDRKAETRAEIGSDDVRDGTESDDGRDDDESGERSERQRTPSTATPRVDEDDEEWTSADAPVGVDFSDVVAAGDGAYAVGEDGYVLAWADGEWTTVLEDGPAAQGENLTGVDATDDGRAVWVTGDGGALARFDAASNRHTDHSAPDGDTSTVSDIAVFGDAGAEVVVLVNGSGEVRRGEYDGERVQWGAPEKPGSGSSFSAVAFADGERGYLADTNGSVFRTTDGGETYDALGIDDAGALTAVAAVSGGGSNTEAFVAEDDGTVHRYDGAQWTPVRPTEEGLWAMAVVSQTDRVVAVGEHGTALDGGGGDWQHCETPTDETLRGVCVAADRQVAVGDAGVLLERQCARRTTDRPQ